MALSPVVIEKFPGIDLREDPGDSAGALDAFNVTVEQGRVRTRAGSVALFPSVAQPVFAALNQRVNTAHLIVATIGVPGALAAISTAGANLGSSTITDIRLDGASGAAIGTPSASYFYVASPHGGSVVKRWDGTAWSSPAGFPAGTQVLVHSQTDNRLVATVGSQANFSDPGAPETFGALNYVGLGVGDGEEIQGGCWFNNQLFLFKATKFFVFYGTSINGATGNPEFLYRTVNTGIGMWDYAPQACCVGADGVYFIGNDGIYRTTGGPPSKISGALDPFFEGTAGPTWPHGAWDATNKGQRLLWLDGVLYCALGTTAGVAKIMMEWDSRLNVWTVHSHAPAALTPFPVATTEGSALGLVFGGPATGLARRSNGATSDSGAPILSRYRMAFESFGSPQQKLIREAILEGTGTPTLKWSHDWGDLEAGGAVALGAGPTPATKRRRRAVRGRHFSLQVGAFSLSPWSINRIQLNLDTIARPASVTV